MAGADPGGVEPQRPLVHFTPPYGWMNDPNGLVHADGLFHLCYQHHPDGLDWGPMHWGHATSRDLVSWRHQPMALIPDHLGAAFSGSAVVDHDGVAGFGRGALVAFYTHFQEDVPQCQGVAYSVDGGTTWQPYDGNPVLDAPGGLTDFRDPKVFRYDEGDGPGHWVMVLAAGQEVALYRSDDLLHWEPSSRFGLRHGAHGGLWETPDLFELEVEETGERRWVLVVSVQEGGPAGGSGTQYFVGDFDGKAFAGDDPPEVVRWVDHGADFYAPQSWSDAPDGRRIWLAWMSNWAYARSTPARTWRGAMTVPRDVFLHRWFDRLVLAQRPVREVERRGQVVVSGESVKLAPGEVWEAEQAPIAADLRVCFEVSEDAGAFGVETHRGRGNATRVGYLPERGVLQVRRPANGIGGTAQDSVQEVALEPLDGLVDLRVVVDTCSVEVFAADGRVVLTNQVFPGSGSTGFGAFAEGAPVVLRSFELRDLSAG